MGKKVTGVVLGIGMNVESSPDIEPTRFVPSAGCINEFLSENNQVTQKQIFKLLINALKTNYLRLLNGDYTYLLDIYRNHSCILSKNIRIWSDNESGDSEILFEGIASHIGENLELYLKNIEKPIYNGRLEIL